MKLFCIEEFKIQFEKLITKKSYKELEQDIIDFFFDKTVSDVCSGTRLNASNETPYIKKRLNGSGGFRLYYYILIKNDCLYLMFVHPKKGVYGSPNITDESKSYLYKQVLHCIKENELFEVLRDENGEKLIFKKVESVERFSKK